MSAQHGRLWVDRAPRSSVILVATARSRTSSELLADLVADARLVKAANTLSAEVLASDPHEAGGQRVILISGDDTDAKRTLSRCSRKRASPRSTGFVVFGMFAATRAIALVVWRFARIE